MATLARIALAFATLVALWALNASPLYPLPIWH